MSDVEVGSFGKRALLVGAGFSKNWGGRLASEVWADIFSDAAVQQRDRVRQLLLRERSFEEVLREVLIEDNYDADDRRAISEAVTKTFEKMDALYSGKTLISADRIINYGTLQYLLRRFREQTGYIFSLNQDRLLEFLLENRNIAYQIPHVSQGGLCKIPNDRPSPLPRTYAASFNLVKLHGSHTWRNDNNVPLMVIGKQKENAIAGSWLLTEYMKIFETVLYSGSVRLLALGYSFRDPHINTIISRAVSLHRCKVFVWNPEHPLDTLRQEAGGKDTEAILDGLIGWEPRLIGDVMPTVRTIQVADEGVLAAFFQ